MGLTEMYGNRFLRNNIAYKVSGYTGFDPHLDKGDDFEQAKKQLIHSIEIELEVLKEMDFQEFWKRKANNFK